MIAQGLGESGHSAAVATLYEGDALARASRDGGTPTYHFGELPLVCRAFRRLRPWAMPFSEYDPWWSARASSWLHGVVEEFRPDILHSHDPHATLIAGRVARRTGLPWVVTDHSGPGTWRDDRDLPNRIRLRRYGHVLTRALAVMVVSHVARDELLGHYPWLADRTQVVPNAADPPRDFTPQPAQRPTIAVVGRLHAHKNHVTLLRALDRVRRVVPEVCLLVAGDGRMEGALRELARETGLEHNVEFMGQVLCPWEVYAKAWVAASLSRAESFGISVLEACAAGLPVLVSEHPAHREVTGGERNAILVDPDDVEAAAEALTRLLTDADLRHRLGANAAQRAREYSQEAFMDRHLAAYGDAMRTASACTRTGEDASG